MFKIDNLNKLTNAGNTKALFDVIFDDTFVVKGFKIMEGVDGPFVSMPSKKGKDDKYVDTCRPLTVNAKKELEKVVLEAYGVI